MMSALLDGLFVICVEIRSFFLFLIICSSVGDHTGPVGGSAHLIHNIVGY
jgi:hypothetical protein